MQPLYESDYHEEVVTSCCKGGTLRSRILVAFMSIEEVLVVMLKARIVFLVGEKGG